MYQWIVEVLLCSLQSIPPYLKAEKRLNLCVKLFLSFQHVFEDWAKFFVFCFDFVFAQRFHICVDFFDDFS